MPIPTYTLTPGGTADRWGWTLEAWEHTQPYSETRECPKQIEPFLLELPPEWGGELWQQEGCIVYRSIAEAMAALSTAAILWARFQNEDKP